ncbi:50S ribosomal protein L30 [Streptomonospora sp. S1-112]|uniref:Large ribosomal subunit protein uL30 n=1 Tax=Streptomonospora mangrovi TaxID=2883123 RepID=A0A9X3NWX7_9ACTN|nr:50S ribosomal protein L30 [Streptomonospora mangrovi]MDA0565821.1 50S ribosomal protein L30 [Streptomonospora mangrovi]
MANKLKITQVRSKIGGKQKQRDSLRSLGLRKIGSSVVREDSPSVRGQISVVAHLVSVEEVDE